MKCRDCKGKGKIELFTSIQKCELCEGTGEVWNDVSRFTGHDAMIRVESIAFPIDVLIDGKRLSRPPVLPEDDQLDPAKGSSHPQPGTSYTEQMKGRWQSYLEHKYHRLEQIMLCKGLEN